MAQAEEVTEKPVCVLQTPKHLWESETLPWERKWWEQRFTSWNPVDGESLRECSRLLWERFGFRRDEFVDKLVMDVGCGPTGRLEWFEGSFTGIDPLMGEYERIGGLLECYATRIDAPAEERIGGFAGELDAVLSVNALDHGYDFVKAVENIASYLKPGGLFFLSVGCDKCFKPGSDHPLSLPHNTVTNILLESGFSVDKLDSGRVFTGDGEGGVKEQDTWSGGRAFHWWAYKE